MTRRRIVVVNQYFPPDTSATASIVEDFAAACAQKRVPVTIVSGYPSYDPAGRPRWRPLRRVRIGGATHYVVGSTGFDRRSPPGRVLNYVTFLLGAAVLAPVLSTHAAFIAMTDPPMAPLLAWWVRRIGRPATVTIWVQDLHPDFGVAAGLVREGVLVRVWRGAVRGALRDADEVVVLGRDMAERVSALGVDAPARVIHNGWSGVAPTPPVRERDAAPLRVMHFGNIGFGGPWPSVLAAASRLEGVAEFVFVGGGAGEGNFADAPRNVTLRPRVPHDEVATLAAEADLLLVGVRSGLEGYVVPSKGYEMMAMGRPLLVVSDQTSEMRRLVDEHRCGLSVEDAPDALVAALEVAADQRDELRAMGERAVAAAEGFRRSAQFATFVDVLSPT